MGEKSITESFPLTHYRQYMPLKRQITTFEDSDSAMGIRQLTRLISTMVDNA